MRLPVCSHIRAPDLDSPWLRSAQAGVCRLQIADTQPGVRTSHFRSADRPCNVYLFAGGLPSIERQFCFYFDLKTPYRCKIIVSTSNEIFSDCSYFRKLKSHQNHFLYHRLNSVWVHQQSNSTLAKVTCRFHLALNSVQRRTCQTESMLTIKNCPYRRILNSSVRIRALLLSCTANWHSCRSSDYPVPVTFRDPYSTEILRSYFVRSNCSVLRSTCRPIQSTLLYRCRLHGNVT